LPARRSFGGVLGICDFRHKTPKQSYLLPGPKDQVFQGKIKGMGLKTLKGGTDP